MPFWSSLKRLLSGKDDDYAAVRSYPAGTLPVDKDTLAVISDLSKAAMHNPGAVEVYLALGNLYRGQGEIERALQIRRALLVRRELPQSIKARAYFEMGQDYRRAGLMDRAISAYHEAGRLGMNSRDISAELASLYADSGNFIQASAYFGRIGHKAAEAHFMVRQAKDLLHQGLSPDEALRLTKKALKVYTASPEAWQATIGLTALAGRWKQAAALLQNALSKIGPDKTFLLLEGLLQLNPAANDLSAPLTPGAEPEQSGRTEEFFRNMTDFFLPVLDTHGRELLPLYYAAVLTARSGRTEEASVYLAKSLVLSPEFWSARLLLLQISLKEYSLSPVLAGQLEYFMAQAGHVKKYHCAACGLRREQLFYCCPRCHSWHSAALRTSMD